MKNLSRMNNVARAIVGVLFGAAVLTATCRAEADDGSKKPHRLARDAGCYTCHDVESDPAGSQSLLPVAPSFEDIARRYRADPQAADKLTSIVLEGTGPLRRDRHWNGKATFEKMYPNDLEVSAEEARKIVEWILTLSPAQSAGRDRRAQRADDASRR
jgi:cytochrome c